MRAAGACAGPGTRWVDAAIEAGHANVWAPMSVDEEAGLVFLPTSSPSPDFWGGKRPGNNEHANSVVALRAETGALVWAFQGVHHDVWDYDMPAQPTLARIDTGNGWRDVVIQPTKQGFLFVLDKDDGQADLAGARSGPCRKVARKASSSRRRSRFPLMCPSSRRSASRADDAFGLIPFWDRAACRDRLAATRNEGLYTPPSTKGTLIFPMTGGGVNWGGVAFDPVNQIVYANTSRAVHIVTLIPAAAGRAASRRLPGHDFGPQRGAPFAMTRAVALSPLGLPCNPPPWGVLVAVDLKAGKILWQSRVGTTEDIAPLGLPFPFGTPLVNGVLVTAGGLVFTGAMDAYLRAFDAKTGRRAVAGPAAGARRRQSHDLHVERGAIRGDRRRRPFRGRDVDRRQRCRLPSGAGGRIRLPSGRAPSTGRAVGCGRA